MFIFSAQPPPWGRSARGCRQADVHPSTPRLGAQPSCTTHDHVVTLTVRLVWDRRWWGEGVPVEGECGIDPRRRQVHRFAGPPPYPRMYPISISLRVSSAGV